jgi:hypothetical protein
VLDRRGILQLGRRGRFSWDYTGAWAAAKRHARTRSGAAATGVKPAAKSRRRGGHGPGARPTGIIVVASLVDEVAIASVDHVRTGRGPCLAAIIGTVAAPVTIIPSIIVVSIIFEPSSSQTQAGVGVGVLWLARGHRGAGSRGGSNRTRLKGWFCTAPLCSRGAAGRGGALFSPGTQRFAWSNGVVQVQ